MAKEKCERARWFVRESMEAMNRKDMNYARDCLNRVVALISPKSDKIEEIDLLATALQFKFICGATPEEALNSLKESIRIEESVLSSKSQPDKIYSYANLATKYETLGNRSKAIEYADKVDIDSVEIERRSIEILFCLFGVYSKIRGKGDSKAKKALIRGEYVAEKFDDKQNCVKAYIELANIALRYERDKALAVFYCEQAWGWETRDGFEKVKDLGALLNICKIASDCIPNNRGLTWSVRIMITMASIIESDYIDPDVARMYLTTAYTIEYLKPQETVNQDWAAKCMKVFEKDKKGLEACLSEATRRSKIYPLDS
jgi:tetratricopeptide (TPR) repeat protein